MVYCRFCDEECRDAKELKKHKKNCDMNPANSRQGAFRCNYCHKAFPNKDALRTHLKSCSYAPAKRIDFEDFE